MIGPLTTVAPTTIVIRRPAGICALLVRQRPRPYDEMAQLLGARQIALSF